MSTCFFHKADLDGISSGAIVKYKNPKCKMIGVDYDDVIDVFKHVELGREVYIVDFCFDYETMKKLNEKCHLIWIDHHKSSIEKCKDLDIKGKREIGKGACELTWEYLCQEKGLPKFIELLSKYDVFNKKNQVEWDNYILPFQYGMKLLNKDVNSKYWLNLLTEYRKSEINAIILKGNIVLKYQKQHNEKICQNAFLIENFEGYYAICVNSNIYNSMVFDSIYDTSKHDIMICFSYTGNKWKISLYTKKHIDVSEIAKEYGGGGHKQASGFVLNNKDFARLIRNKFDFSLLKL